MRLGKILSVGEIAEDIPVAEPAAAAAEPAGAAPQEDQVPAAHTGG